jgi:hypothetical protein
MFLVCSILSSGAVACSSNYQSHHEAEQACLKWRGQGELTNRWCKEDEKTEQILGIVMESGNPIEVSQRFYY